MVCRHMYDPCKGYWVLVSWILRCIRGKSVDIGLVIENDTCGEQLCAKYVDSDYLRDRDKSWCSSLQSIAALTDTEAIEKAAWLCVKRVDVRFC